MKKWFLIVYKIIVIATIIFINYCPKASCSDNKPTEKDYLSAYKSAKNILKLIKEGNWKEIEKKYVIKETDELSVIRFKQSRFAMIDRIKRENKKFNAFNLDFSSKYYDPQGLINHICFKTNIIDGEYMIFYIDCQPPYNPDFIYYFKKNTTR